eukprot:m.204303 g.204303  ORF g.204303 m.204303 type:complete len:563 (+) comp53863_c0_seq3:38-1726(+)
MQRLDVEQLDLSRQTELQIPNARTTEKALLSQQLAASRARINSSRAGSQVAYDGFHAPSLSRTKHSGAHEPTRATTLPGMLPLSTILENLDRDLASKAEANAQRRRLSLASHSDSALHPEPAVPATDATARASVEPAADSSTYEEPNVLIESAIEIEKQVLATQKANQATLKRLRAIYSIMQQITRDSRSREAAEDHLASPQSIQDARFLHSSQVDQEIYPPASSSALHGPSRTMSSVPSLTSGRPSTLTPSGSQGVRESRARSPTRGPRPHSPLPVGVRAQSPARAQTERSRSPSPARSPHGHATALWKSNVNALKRHHVLEEPVSWEDLTGGKKTRQVAAAFAQSRNNPKHVKGSASLPALKLSNGPFAQSSEATLQVKQEHRKLFQEERRHMLRAFEEKMKYKEFARELAMNEHLKSITASMNTSPKADVEPHLKYMARRAHLKSRQKYNHLSHESKTAWFRNLSMQLHAEMDSDKLIAGWMAKLQKFTSENKCVLITKPRFLAVVALMPKWELCTDEMQAALLFMRDQVLCLDHAEFASWMFERHLPLFPLRADCVDS